MLSINHSRIHLLKPTRILINWGCSESLDYEPHCKIINHPTAVALASNKLRTFNYWSSAGVSCPEWTTDYYTGLEWVEDGNTVFCRTKLQAHSGDGIIIADNKDAYVSAPLYTKYIKKKKEFRVHVFNNEVIDIQEKRLSSNAPEGNWLIRNHSNGFVFCRDNIIEPADLRNVGLLAVSSLGLNFGAVDIIYNQHYNKCYALEVNTAPGLEGTTLQSYTNKIREVAYG